MSWSGLWDINFLFVHLFALWACVMLFSSAPDELQKAMLVVIGAAALIYIGADLWALTFQEPAWPIRMVASRIEHAGVLIYLFRQVWIKSEICRSLKSSSSGRS